MPVAGLFYFYSIMTLPFFYTREYNSAQKEIVLDEIMSKHVVQVLRMKTGEQLNLTDGNGHLITAAIADAHKKYCSVSVISARLLTPEPRQIAIAISLTKNANRFEWFLEKATEIGVKEIIPLLCERTEKEKFRYDRMQQICISAMLQSQQCWLPVLHEPQKFEDWVTRQPGNTQKLIAHCTEGDKKPLGINPIDKSSNCLIAIGPEGDFTEKEIELALRHHFIPVTLGETRLRTETAGVVAVVLLSHI